MKSTKGRGSMRPLGSHKELDVWQRAMDLTIEIYRLSASFPRTEQFGLTAQITRAAVSVPANIAEGNARSTRRDYAHFVSIAKGSLVETETLLLLAVRLRYTQEDLALPALELTSRVGKMLTMLRARLLSRS